MNYKVIESRTRSLSWKYGEQAIDGEFKLFPGQRRRYEDDLIISFQEANQDLDEEFKVEVEPGDKPEDHWGWTRLIPQGAREFTRSVWLQLLEANKSLNVLDTEERVAEAWFRRFTIVDVISAMVGYQHVVYPSVQDIEGDFIAITIDGRLLIGTQGAQSLGIDYIAHPFSGEPQYGVIRDVKSTLEQEADNIVAIYLTGEQIDPGIFEVAQAMSGAILEETERALHPESFLR